MFFVNPTTADVSGDGYPEVLIGTGGYYVHAFDACGEEPEGWPKFVGGWVTSSAAMGDIDGDDLLEVAITTRNGYLYVWDTEGPADGAITWPEFRHDNHNSGNFENDLPNGGQKLFAESPIECDIPVRPDPDAAPATRGTRTRDRTRGSASAAGEGATAAWSARGTRRAMPSRGRRWRCWALWSPGVVGEHLDREPIAGAGGDPPLAQKDVLSVPRQRRGPRAEEIPVRQDHRLAVHGVVVTVQAPEETDDFDHLEIRDRQTDRDVIYLRRWTRTVA